MRHITKAIGFTSLFLACGTGLLVACGDDSGGGNAGSGGKLSTGGSSNGSGGAKTGGSSAGGAAMVGTGGNAHVGGAPSAGGSGMAGSSSGGNAAGGSPAGGANTGGVGTGAMGGGGGAGGAGGDVAGGGAGGATCRRSEFQDPEKLNVLSPLPAPPADPTNQYADNVLARALGQRFFFDKAFSGAIGTAIQTGNPAQTGVNPLGNTVEAGKVACASCHTGPSLDDRGSPLQIISLGTGAGTRNAPGVVNSSFYKWINGGGRFSAQWELSVAVAENGVLLNSNRLKIAHRSFDKYKTEYEAILARLSPRLGPTPRGSRPKASSA